MVTTWQCDETAFCLRCSLKCCVNACKVAAVAPRVLQGLHSVTQCCPAALHLSCMLCLLAAALLQPRQLSGCLLLVGRLYLLSPGGLTSQAEPPIQSISNSSSMAEKAVANEAH